MKKFIYLSLMFVANFSVAESDLLTKLDSEMEKSQLLSFCPADLYSDSKEIFRGYYEYCAIKPNVCLKSCLQGDANKCFGLGYNLQQNKNIKPDYGEYLFALSCKEGLSIGCVNRAAYIYDDENKQSCAVKTFQLTCNLDDAWGCAMYGLALADGKGTEKNMIKAKSILRKTCQIDTQSDACKNASRLEEQLKSHSEK